MNKFKVFLSGVLAGVAIAIGGTVFLSVDNKVVGAIFFAVGLFTVCVMGLNLFTGKVCYVFDNKAPYAVNLIFIWLGNLFGTTLVAALERQTRIASAIVEKAQGMVQTKLDDSLISLFILGFFCNILIYIAVDGYKNINDAFGKYLALIFGVAVFILCGTEHCVADMYYVAVAGEISGRAALCLLVITAGNILGGIFFPVIRKIFS